MKQQLELNSKNKQLTRAFNGYGGQLEREIVMSITNALQMKCK